MQIKDRDACVAEDRCNVQFGLQGLSDCYTNDGIEIMQHSHFSTLLAHEDLHPSLSCLPRATTSTHRLRKPSKLYINYTLKQSCLSSFLPASEIMRSTIFLLAVALSYGPFVASAPLGASRYLKAS